MKSCLHQTPMLNKVLMMLSRAKFFVQALSNKDSIKIFSKPLDKAENMVYNIYRLNFRITDMRYTMIYGYARVSTANQKLERQTENIRRDYPDVTLMTEKFTGTTTDRPEWVRLMKKVRAGDTIVFDSVSRMSRNKTEGVEDYFDLYNKGVELIFLKEPHIKHERISERSEDRCTADRNKR